ncbi:protein Smaug homolog 2-like isoform X1 [Acipenser ruthenus]|uniref:protein Smaug homolog 2-like isoform X1 n=1 Tax=Acipenser ruthenus TaxID=7906 RepID=UPI0027407FF7|nr:protein Smaug homolog 2-like isoform X1 [Acipenser ruthenus]XP_033880466.2 protein Smaug homolog 2-like isoform X1 [Acipenser ruthenus]XP_058882655.1 protein Smaug homolog 2-like isoform X1 [Acipenser ruthenus]
MMFRDQVGILTDWFKGWNECEQTVALLSLLKRVTRTQARFLQICLEHSLSDCTEIHILEAEANNAVIVSQWYQEPKEKVVSLLLSHLPLLQPRNAEAKCEYMLLLQKVLTYTIESNLFVEESRQLLSYALIHPATTVEDRTTLAMWLNHLEEHLSSGYSGRASFSSGYHPRQGSDEWTGGQSEIMDPGHVWQDKPATAGQNGHMPFHVSTSVPSAMNSIGSSANTVLSSQIHPSPLKRSMSLVPTSLQVSGSDWTSQEDLGIRGSYVSSDHAPLSPQSSVASSGSEQTEDQGMGRNTFQEEGSGMRDVPTWLKSLRLHKYAALFSQLTYEEMMTLTEHHLESQVWNVTKGARHKIALSIQKLRERQSVLKSLEKDILEGGNLRNALQELQQIIITPIKVHSTPQAAQKEADSASQAPEKGGKQGEDKDQATEGFQSPNPSPCDAEPSAAPIHEGDIAGQFTRVMGKVCTQLLVSRPDEENISCYLQLIEKCLMHEAFTETQKKRLVSWKQQVLKLLRMFPRKAMLDMPGYRQKGWAYGSNSLPTAGSVGAGLGRRGQRQFQMPPRGLTPSRMGLLSPAGIGGASPRHTLTSPALGGQGRQSLWFANPGGSNSTPSQSRSSVQRTHSLPVHTSPQAMLMFQQPECQVPGTDLEINPTLESLCLSMTEHALGDGMDRTSTI